MPLSHPSEELNIAKRALSVFIRDVLLRTNEFFMKPPLTLKMYILPSPDPNSKADVRLGLGQSSLVESSCKAEVGCISDKWVKNFLSSSWNLHRLLEKDWTNVVS